jgi:hypothetical protein
MRKIYLFLFLIIGFNIQTSIYSQTSCNCEAFIDQHYEGQIFIYDKPNGLKIDSIKNDLKNEDYLVINIQKDDSNYFYVRIKRSIAALDKSGWIKKSSYVVVTPSNFKNSKKLVLYSKADINSDPKMTLNEYVYLIFEIKACKNDWMYVKAKYKSIEYIGWLAKRNQCSNPYSTCN